MAHQHTVKAFDEDITRLRGLIAEMGGLAEVSINEGMEALVKGSQDLAEKDYRRNAPRFQGENLDRNLALQQRLEEIAREKGCTPAQLALAWLLAQGEDIVPIPGTKRIKYLEENAAAVKIALSSEDLARIASAVPVEQVAGPRYSEPAMRRVNL
jgi:aryl-alcohol dehydrogenase-like predicted oxidoreductase